MSRPAPKPGTDRVRHIATLIVAALFLFAAGCTILPNEEVATIRDPADVPEDLLSPTTPPPTVPNAAADTFEAVVYLFNTELGHLVPKNRLLESSSLTARLQSLFDAQLSEEEIEEGLSNGIPQAAELIEVTESGRTAILDLNQAWTEGDGDRRIALAQIVYTVTHESYNDGAIQEVSIKVEGQSRQVNGADGAEVAKVSRDDYLDFDLNFQQEEIDILEDATTTTLDESSTPQGSDDGADSGAEPTTDSSDSTDSTESDGG